jgi:dTDP-4-amino-4,6-dideoxygalactose transaminase
MTTWKIPWAKTDLTRADIAAAQRPLRSGRLACGPEVEALEAEFAKAHEYAYAIAVSSGMAALRAIQVNTGILSIRITGATFPPVYPLFYGCASTDSSDHLEEEALVLQTALYDSDRIEPVHVDPIIADWCEAAGTFPANHCDAAYSLYPNKQLGAGEGGIICTMDKKRYEWYRSFRNNGRSGSSWEPVQEGMNYRLCEVTAAIARSKLSRLDTILQRRRDLFACYWEALDCGWRDDPAPWSVFTFAYACDCKSERDAVAWALAKARVETRFPFPARPECPRWAQWVDRTLLLPLYYSMTEADQDYVIRAIRRALR